MFRRFFLYTLGTVIITVLSIGLAHATIVLGQFSVKPQKPSAGEPLTLQVVLEDTSLSPVSDAIVFVELRPAGNPEATPVRVDLKETATDGAYQGETTLKAGPYDIFLRDQTYKAEETNAYLDAPLQVGKSNSLQEFNFPPTATARVGWRTWLLWLLGVPLGAALIVSTLILRRGDAAAEGPKATATTPPK